MSAVPLQGGEFMTMDHSSLSGITGLQRFTLPAD